MPGRIASLNAALRWDTDEFDRGTRHIEGAFGKIRGIAQGLSDAVVRFGARMTAGITAPLAAVAGFSIKAASDVKELQSAYDFTFGQISGRMNRWAEETGDAMNRATSEMQQGALAFGQLFNAAAPTEDAAARLSQRFTVLAQDVSSFFNVSPDEALNSLRSGLIGEAEPLRKFGVFLSAAAVQEKALEIGLIDANQELNEQGKIMARAALIAESLASANDDVIRTSGSFANQVRALKADLSEISKEIGERLLPHAERFIQWARDAIKWLRNLPEPVKNAAAGLAIFLAAIGPVSLALSGLVLLLLPLFIARFGIIGQLLIAFLNPIGSAIVYLLRFATSWTAITAVLSRVIPFFLRLLGPIGWVIAALLLFKDKIIKAFSDIWEEAVQTIGPPLQELFARLSQIASTVGAAFDTLMESELGKFLADVVDYLGEVIYWLLRLAGFAVIKAITTLLELLNGIAEAVGGVVETVKRLFEGDWAGAWDAATSVVGNAMVRIASWIKTLFPQLAALLNMMSRVIGTSDFLSAGGNSIGDAVGGVFSKLPELGGDRKGDFGGTGDFALAGKDKKSRKSGRSRTGPTEQDIADRREEIRLSQQLAVAREAGDLELERTLQRQIDLRDQIERYQSAGLSKQAASVAAEKDMLELDQARAEANAKSLDSHERGIDLQLAEMRGDFEHIKMLKDEEFLEKRILLYREQEIDLISATRRATEDLLAVEDARADRLDARLADQEREREIELARIRGDDADTIRALEESLRRDDRISELREGGLSNADAIAKANQEGFDRSRAHLQGTFRDTFRDGLSAALNGNLSSFFENWMKDRTFNALSTVLDRLADSLANLFAGGGNQSGGGLGGLLSGIGSLFGAGGVSFSSLGGSSASAIGAKSLGGLQAGFTPGFNSGGSFQVKGFPGVDQNLLSLNGNPIARVSSGEIMNVQQGGQQSRSGTIIHQKFIIPGGVDLATRAEVYRVGEAARAAALAGMADANRRAG